MRYGRWMLHLQLEAKITLIGADLNKRLINSKPQGLHPEIRVIKHSHG